MESINTTCSLYLSYSIQCVGGGAEGEVVQYLYLFNFARIFAMFTAMHVRNISCPCVYGARQSLEMALRGKDVVAGIQLAC